MLDLQFAALGAYASDQKGALVKDSQSSYKFYASGRRHCMGFIATLEVPVSFLVRSMSGSGVSQRLSENVTNGRHFIVRRWCGNRCRGRHVVLCMRWLVAPTPSRYLFSRPGAVQHRDGARHCGSTVVSTFSRFDCGMSMLHRILRPTDHRNPNEFRRNGALCFRGGPTKAGEEVSAFFEGSGALHVLAAVLD